MMAKKPEADSVVLTFRVPAALVYRVDEVQHRLCQKHELLRLDPTLAGRSAMLRILLARGLEVFEDELGIRRADP